MAAVERVAVLDEEVSLSDLLRTVWRGRWTLLSGVLVGAAIALAAAYVVPKTFRSSVVLSAASSSPGRESGLGSVAAQLGGLASLAGLGGGDTRKWESIAVLESYGLAAEFIERGKLLPALFPDRWDLSAQRWKVSAERVPETWDGVREMQRSVRAVSTDSKTGLVTLTVSWKDPMVAAEWANGLVRLTNEIQRTRAIAEAERNIDYLSEQASKTSDVDLRRAIYDLIKAEINKAMLAKGNDEFAFRIVDAAVPARKPSSPLPLLWTVAGALAGALIASTAVFFRSTARSR